MPNKYLTSKETKPIYLRTLTGLVGSYKMIYMHWYNFMSTWLTVLSSQAPSVTVSEHYYYLLLQQCSEDVCYFYLGLLPDEKQTTENCLKNSTSAIHWTLCNNTNLHLPKQFIFASKGFGEWEWELVGEQELVGEAIRNKLLESGN